MKSAIGAGAARDRRPLGAHLIGQNIGLLLVVVLLVAAVLLYCLFYWIRQQALPGNFELTSTVNNTMPLAMAAIGQTIVVLTRGLDLSVGGIIDLTNALAAIHVKTASAACSSGPCWCCWWARRPVS